MPSSFTSRLRLELQADGENDTTWGQKLNTGWQLVEDAIAGMSTISTTGGTSVLTTVNAATDQSRMAILKVSGTLVSNSTIQIPAVSKWYMIWNATSGAFTVTVKTSGGTGVAITQGKRAIVFCDATDTYAAYTDQAQLDATLTALANVTTAADKVIYATGSDAFSTTDLTSFARTVLDDTTGAAMMTTMGALPKAGGTMTGLLEWGPSGLAGLETNGDVTAARSGGTTGYTFFGTSGTRSVGYNGTNYEFAGAQLTINGGTAWHSGNDGAGSGLDADVLDGLGPTSAATGSTIMSRDANGDTSLRRLTISENGCYINLSDTGYGVRQIHHNDGNAGFLTTGGAWAYYSDNSGNFIAAGNVTAFSDDDLKTNHVAMVGMLPYLRKLSGFWFDWRDIKANLDKAGTSDFGLSAQNVQSVFPQAVTEMRSPDPDEDRTYLSVNYAKLVAPILSGLVELYDKWRAGEFVWERTQAVVNKYEARIMELEHAKSTLEATVTGLSARLEAMEARLK